MKLNNKVTIALLFIFCFISFSLHLYKINEPCLNEDEASQGYNTYSVLKTGKDEYGKTPIRYLSFGENKLPLTGMLSAPFIGLFGLNELSVRLPVYILGTLFPVLFYFATFSLTKTNRIALIAAFIASGNIWLQTTSRHQHEAVVLAAIVLIYISIFFWRKSLSKLQVILLSAVLFLGMYTYHSAKITMPALGVFTVFYSFATTKNNVLLKVKRTAFVFVTLALGILIFLFTELAVPNNRIGNLSYFTNPIFIHEIQEGRRLGESSILYNKVSYGTYKLAERSVRYLLPDFLLAKSDPNPRYGAEYLQLFTIPEYFLFIFGLASTFISFLKKRDLIQYFFLYYLIFITVLPASLALPNYSSTRSYLLLIPMIIISAIGAFQITKIICTKTKKISFAIILLGTFAFYYLGAITMSWNIYFNRYLNDPKTRTSWQCGMKELSQYAWQNYSRYESVNVSNKMGQPYIFLLFYGGPYPPNKYQKVAKTMPYNEYGFWEQESFDKFIFVDKQPTIGENKGIFLDPRNFSKIYP